VTFAEARPRIVKEIAARARVDEARVTASAHLVLEVGLSSLDLLHVLALTEHLCGARFPDAQLGTLVTLDLIEAACAQHRVAA
jgi:acyl carrier protein